jgi:hypothetical protein
MSRSALLLAQVTDAPSLSWNPHMTLPRPAPDSLTCTLNLCIQCCGIRQFFEGEPPLGRKLGSADRVNRVRGSVNASFILPHDE